MKQFIHQSGRLAAGIFALAAFWVGQPLAAVTFTDTPAAVFNAYDGNVTLRVGGLAAGDTVVVQKFLDLNTNGIIDGSDLLLQQFQMTDGQAGMVIGGVTNFDVPGDLDTTAGSITAQLHFNNGDFAQRIAGHYLWKLSSPVGHFTPVTNLFVVTNSPYAQKFTGLVLSNSTSTTLPGAIVLLFPAPRGGNHGPGTPVAGAVADSSGSYTIPAPPGTYVPLAIGVNYVSDYASATVQTLGSGSTITTNLTMTAATAAISGQILDDSNSVPLPGVFLPVSTKTGLISVTFSDTNGNFTAGVTSGQWSLGSDDSGLIIHGYVGWNNNIKANAGATGVILGYPKANALFYGNVSDNLGNPLSGIDLNASDVYSNLLAMDAYTDTNGNYQLCLRAGLNNDSYWQLQVGGGGSSTAANYVYSSSSIPQQNGGVSVASGQVLRADITAIYGTNHISGRVVDNLGNPISGVGLFANATINGVNYFPLSVDTGTNGDYAFNVPNATWDVAVDCSGASDSLNNLGSYACPNDQMANILNSNSTNDFIVEICGGVLILTTNLPDGTSGTQYNQSLAAESCNPSFSWSVTGGNLAASGLTLSPDGNLSGIPNAGTYDFTVHVVDGGSAFADQNLSLVIGTNNVVRPTMSVSTASGGKITVSYPLSDTNDAVETTTNLATGPWVPAGPWVAGSNGTSVVTLTFSNAAPAQYFRLVVH